MSDKYISKDNLKLVMDGFKLGTMADWNENDKSAPGYIRNKPFCTEKGVIVDNYSGGRPIPKCNFVSGNKYDVVWNGVTYEGLVCYIDGNYNCIGGDGYPFYIDDDGGNSFYTMPESGFTVSILGDIVHQLDEKYIPDDIARVDDIEENLVGPLADLRADLDNGLNALENTLNTNISTHNTSATAHNDIRKAVTANAAAIKERMRYESELAYMPCEDGRYWKEFAYGNGKFVVTTTSVYSNTNKYVVIYHSTDCVEWAQSLVLSGCDGAQCVYGNGKFMFLTKNMSSNIPVAYYSRDGINWTQTTVPLDGNDVPALFYCGGKFFLSYGGSMGACSLDGINWTQCTQPSDRSFTNMVYGNNKFVAITQGGDGVGIWQSVDGTSWTRAATGRCFNRLYYANNKFILSDHYNSSSGFAYSEDAISWTHVRPPMLAEVIYGDNKFIALNLVKEGKYDGVCLCSTDGINWTEISTIPLSGYINIDLYYMDGKFIIVNRESPYEIYCSIDGTVWEQISQNSIIQSDADITDKVKKLVSVQPDWNQNDENALDYIKNKPKTYITLTDVENGYEYVIYMKNGNLTSVRKIERLKITTYPTKIEYVAGEAFDPSGMIVVGVYHDGTTREITDYTYYADDFTPDNMVFTVYYKEAGITYSIDVDLIKDVYLVDFDYINNGDGTYTLTGWKGTLNGEPSTELVIPSGPKFIL